MLCQIWNNDPFGTDLDYCLSGCESYVNFDYEYAFSQCIDGPEYNSVVRPIAYYLTVTIDNAPGCSDFDEVLIPFSREWEGPPFYSTQTAQPFLPSEVYHCITLGGQLPDLLENCPYCITVSGYVVWQNLVPTDASIPPGGLGRYYAYIEFFERVQQCNG